MKKNKKREQKKLPPKNLFLIIIIALAIIILIIALLALALVLNIPYYPSNYENITFSSNTVIDVIDGDTITLYSGDKVRLLCIDTPEEGEENYEEAKDFLSGLVLGKEVILKKGSDNKDAYDRLLRFVYITDPETDELIFINQEIYLNNFTEIYNFANQTNCKTKLK